MILIIKGDMRDAVHALQSRGVTPHTMEALGGYRQVKATVDGRYSGLAASWFAETDPVGDIFPAGCLLWYGNGMPSRPIATV